MLNLSCNSNNCDNKRTNNIKHLHNIKKIYSMRIKKAKITSSKSRLHKFIKLQNKIIKKLQLKLYQNSAQLNQISKKMHNFSQIFTITDNHHGLGLQIACGDAKIVFHNNGCITINSIECKINAINKVNIIGNAIYLN